MTAKTTDFTIATFADVPTTSEKGCLIHVGAADGSNGYSLGIGNTTFDDVGNNLIFEACPNQFTVLGSIGTGWHHLAAVIDANQNIVGFVDGPDPALQAWSSTVVANGGSVSVARQGLLDKLIRGLKTDGVWAKLDRLWIFAAENTTSALVDLVADSLATTVNSVTFTTDRGYAGNGSNSYVNTGFNLATNAVQYTRNAAHCSIWNITNRAASTAKVIYGASDGTNISDLFALYDTRTIARIQGSSAHNCQPTGVTSDGFYSVVRTTSTNALIYRNGSSMGSPFDTAASNTVPSHVVFIGGRNESGSFYGPSATTEQFAAFSAGGALTATEASNLYNRLRTYMTAVGVP